MIPLTRGQRIYLGAVAALALWVGVWCLVPGMSDFALPWLVPPLCAAFLGAMYLSGAVFTGTCMRARRWADVRVILPMIVIWTGGLAVVSLFHLPRFDFARPQVWIWFGAYVAYPLIALRLMWTHRRQSSVPPPGEPALPGWARVYLAGQGSLLVALGLSLLGMTQMMLPLWPWQTGRLMLQLYSMPLLSYGIGSFILARQRTWSAIRLALISIGVFSGVMLAGSLWHSSLMNGPALSAAAWYVWLAAITAVLAWLSRLAVLHSPSAAQGRLAWGRLAEQA
jgi:hypothetical protein